MKKATIDCSDLTGTYKLGEMPKLLGEIKSRIKEVMDMDKLKKDYVKASDLKIGDYLFVSEYGDINENIKINQIKYLELSGIKWIIFNELYVFKYFSSKGFKFYPHQLVKSYEEIRSSYDYYEKNSITIFCSDKRVATTHAVNYIKSQIKDCENFITKNAREIYQLSNKLASLRFEEHN
jgi:hypothetical protein